MNLALAIYDWRSQRMMMTIACSYSQPTIGIAHMRMHTRSLYDANMCVGESVVWQCHHQCP